MRCKHQPRADVVTCKDKEQKARDFIQDYIKKLGPQPQTQTQCTGPDAFLLIARSPESPIATALAALSHEICDAGIKVRAIFSHFGSSGCALDWTTADLDIAFARELRWARHRALLDAHEQLVLGPATIWTGDCMRREPGGPHAYECYAADCADAAGGAALSFERFWLACEPVIAHGDENAAGESLDPAAGVAVPAELAILDEAAGDDGTAPATRH